MSHRRDNFEIQSIFDADGFLKFDYLDAIIEKSLQQQLRVNIIDTPILFTENAIHNKEQRMKLTEYMFEKYKIPALFIVKDPVLCAFSYGKSSALILDVGHKSTIATPVNDGYALLKCIVKHDIGGHNLTLDLQDLLTKKGANIRPRWSFKKKFLQTDGQELMQLQEVSPELLAGTTKNFTEWCQQEIVREIKEDFLAISDEILQQKITD